jgi:RNA polymerase sigma-70 factor (ECF subfamily)
MPPLDEALVDELHAKSTAGRWGVAREDFARALEVSAGKAFSGPVSARELERYLRTLRLDELALACACAAGREAAWDHFVLEYRPILYRAADAIDPGGGARELADALYADLFGVEERSGRRQSLFRYFHGRSSLATWLRAVLARRHVDRLRDRARSAPLAGPEPAAPDREPPDPERVRDFARLQAALHEAVARLDPRDRLRLRYYYAQGLTLAETGRLMHEHEASVSRHLTAARKSIRRDVERQLREDGLGADEIARCFESVSEDPGPLDLDRLLVEEGQAARNRGAAVQSTSEPRPRRRQPAAGDRLDETQRGEGSVR